jgi:hypothetical protein
VTDVDHQLLTLPPNEVQMRVVFALGAAAVLLPFTLAGQSTNGNALGRVPNGEVSSASAASAARATAPPVIDGIPGDPEWDAAPVIDQFLEYEPNEGAETRFRTEARVLYDDRNLYVQVRMFDPAPDSIVSQLSRRDVRAYSEHIKLVIDSYHDRRTAYQFALNPAGVKRDFYVHGDANEDPSWDAVWDGEATIDSLGWTAEFRIPLSQLRFGNKPEHTWGLMIVRDIARTGQRISWPLYRRNVQGYVSQSGVISGIRDLPSPRRLEIVPYVVTKNVTVPDATGFGHEQQTTGGADIKYGLASNLTLDATINPDFGQVEADPAVLNLTAFETFFQERRPFFLEGTGIFSFRVNCGDIDSGCTGLFYSRRIGRSPQLGGVYSDPSNATATTIVGATKLTGRLGNGLSIGVLDAVTQEERDPLDQTIEPRTNYAVARLQQDLNDGQSGIGVMFTGVNRQLDEFSDDFLRRSAYAGGVDLRHRFLNGDYELAAMVSGSRVSGTPEAIGLLQQCSGFGCTHNYARPDGEVEFDPTRTSLNGNAQRVSVSKFGGARTRFQSVYQRYSAGYDINDLGFLARDDQQLFRNWFALRYNEPTSVYRTAQFNFNHYTDWTAGGLTTGFGLNQNSHVQFQNQMWAHLGFNYSPEWVTTFDDRTARGGPAVRKSASANFWGGIEGDGRKRVTPYFWFGGGKSDDGRSDFWYVEPTVSFRASSRFELSFGAFYESSVNDNQFRGNLEDSAGTHHTFARLDQSTLRLTSRLNVTATPTLSLQVYAQPFISTGTYTDWRELADPRAKEYGDRYQTFNGGDPGGFNFKQFQSNTVVRWEYRPGSALFFVWSQGRDTFDSQASEFRFSRDTRHLFRQHPNNTFLIKASYWFNP